MTQLDKLIRKFIARPPEVRFSDARRLLMAFGFTVARTRGSHHLFEHPDGRQLSLPVSDGRIKRVYVTRVVELLGLEKPK